MKVFQLFVAAAILTTIYTSQTIAAIEDTIHESFNVKSGGTLSLESDLGSIEVHATETSKVTVEVVRKVKTSSKKEAAAVLEDFEVTFDQNGDNVSIVAKYPRQHGIFGGFGEKLQVHYIINVPHEYNVDLMTSGGSIAVDALKGSVKAETSGGSLKFGQIEGPVIGKTSGGSISLDGCIGDAQINTSGGGINIGDVQGNVDAETSGGSIQMNRIKGRVAASTSGGGIHIEEATGDVNAETSGGSIFARITKQPEGDCRLSTSGGGVDVYLLSSAEVELDASTSGGNVHTDFDVLVHGTHGQSELSGKINGGGPLLYLRSSGGGIHISKI
jgi:DUF4097 and DUF4098 domain-containing protein YvlB